ncbi:MAG: homocitrate synthase [Chloroflexota bacterium]|nr:homocitrate synthase [Chloroflexota bacterium]
MSKIYFIDVTNRDTVQASRINLSKLQKTMVNYYLGQLGIHQSEFAFPCVRSEQNYIRANLALKERGAMGSLILEGWCRAILPDVEQAITSGVEHINVSISTSDQMITHKFKGKLDRERVLQEMNDAVSYARKQGVKTIGVNAEDSSRTNLDYLVEFAQSAKNAGADRVRYCDTLGYDTPNTIYRRARALAEQVRIPIELHCHNDLGMAVANSLAGAQGAIDGGVDAYVNGSANGLGERAGQADLLSCILAIKFARDMDRYEVGDDIRLDMAGRLADYISYAFGIPIPINQPGVGANAFAHEAGIHADGTLKDRKNYELYDHELLGLEFDQSPVRGRIITTGEFGGIAGFKHVYERLGINFDTRERESFVFELVQRASAHNQYPLRDDELIFIAKYPRQVRKMLMDPEEGYFLDFDSTWQFLDQVERVREKITEYASDSSVGIIAIEPYGPTYGQMLCDHLRQNGNDVVLTTINVQTSEMCDSDKLQGKDKYLLIDNEVITGNACRDALVYLESKGIPRDKVKIAVLEDRTGKTADFACGA